jgi:putative OmpL-like beta-barrel porin-2
MKRMGSLLGLKIGLAIFCAMAAMSAPVFAEDAKDAKPAWFTPEAVKNALGLSIYLQGGYTYNPDPTSNAVSDSENDFRVFDNKANSFTLDLVELIFTKETTTTAVGYKVKVSAGETAKWIHANGLGSPAANPNNPDPFDLTEAYVSYIAPIGNGLRFDAGKFATFIGAEVIEALDDPNYSRSFLFNYAEPLTHTGVKGSYVFNDNVNAALFLVNGWDDASDNNDAKSVGVSLNLVSGDLFSGYINYLTGPENTGDNHDNRSLLDLVATIKPLKPLTIILNADFGRNQQDSNVLPSQTWSGISGIVKYDFNETYSISARGETFSAPYGAPNLPAAGPNLTPGQELAEFTLTPEVRFANGITARLEYRHDHSNLDAFDNSTKSTQNTYSVSAMYRW